MNVLVLNYYPALDPPTSGGELRYFNLYRELSRYFNVTLLSLTHPFHQGFFEFSPNFREYRIPSGAVYNTYKEKIAKKKIGYEYSGLVYAKCGKYPTEYHAVYRKLYNENDIIIHEFPYLIHYDVFMGVDFKPRIYNSHNFETSLVKSLWSGPNAHKYKRLVSGLEKKLVQQADLVFATSKTEKKKFVKKFEIDDQKVKLAPNGIHPEEWIKKRKKSSNPQKTIAFFIGSLHPPNTEAVNFIVNELADKCKNIDFIIAGGCCDFFKEVHKSNVSFLGRIDQQTKFKLFSTVDIAINPMFSGAGTNLKTLEYLSAGIPLISTEVGARGLNLIHAEHYIKGEKENFAKKLCKYSGEGSHFLNDIALKGQKYINKNFSWEFIAKKVKTDIEDLVLIRKNRNINV